MNRIFFIIIGAFFCINVLAQSEPKKMSFRFFDSVLQINSPTIIDLTFPSYVNKISKSVRTIRHIQSTTESYKLHYYESDSKALRREKIIFNTNSSKNFQFFYFNREDYYLGIGYYAHGSKQDDTVNDSVPYILSRLDAYAIFNNVNERYIIIYDKEDVADTLPRLSNSIRIFLLDKNYLAKKILFYNTENGCHLYQVETNKFFKIKKNIDLFKENFSYIFNIDNYNVDNLTKMRKTKNVPLFDWYLK